MRGWVTRVGLVLLALVVGIHATNAPEQIKIALTTRVDEMSVTWVLPDVPLASAPADSRCVYGPSADNMNMTSGVADVWTYDAGGFNGTIFETVLTQLAPDTRVFYQCGSGNLSASSKIYSFPTPPAAMSERTIAVGQHGDMGVSMPEQHFLGHDSAHTQKMMGEEALAGKYDLVINVGDSSYADKYAQPNTHIVDDFWNQMEPVTASCPYMLCAGNHEAQFHFAAHLNRTRMPAPGSGPLARFYYSFNFGAMHVVSFSTEHSVAPGGEQHTFIKEDLAKVNRTETPWVVAFSHHPLYCTDILTLKPRCEIQGSNFRKDLEDLFLDNGVDLYLSGHNHQYERTWPLYKNEPTSKSFHQANGTVYIVSGAAGDVEGTEPGFLPFSPIRAYGRYGFDTGFGRMFVNRTALRWQYVDSTWRKDLDEFVMTK